MGVDPFSIAMLASSAVSAVGAVKEGNAGYRAGMANAGFQEENARGAELQGALEEARIRREERAMAGEAIAGMGASGIQIGTGSALEALRQSAYNAEYDAMTARFSAATEARAYRLDAQAKRREAKDARKAGFLRAGAAILGGVSDYGAQLKLGRLGANERAALRPGSGSGLSMPVPAGITRDGAYGATGWGG